MTRGCTHCGWNGHPHLCGCLGMLSQALEAGNVAQARTLYRGIAERANRDEQARREAHAEVTS
jgi:hypothetical protein